MTRQSCTPKTTVPKGGLWFRETKGFFKMSRSQNDCTAVIANAYQELGGLEGVDSGCAFKIAPGAVEADPIGPQHYLHMLFRELCDREAQQEEGCCSSIDHNENGTQVKSTWQMVKSHSTSGQLLKLNADDVGFRTLQCKMVEKDIHLVVNLQTCACMRP